jgi:hypothetical protein
MFDRTKQRDMASIIYGIIGVLLIIVVLGVVIARIMYKEPEKITPFQEKTSITTSSSKATYPEGYPTETPIFPDSILMSTTKMEVIGKYNYSITYHLDKTKATSKQIIDYYANELPKVRYQNIKVENEDPDSLISNSLKANNGETTISVSSFESEKDANMNSINIEIQAFPR